MRLRTRTLRIGVAVAVTASGLALTATGADAQTRYLDPHAPIAARVADLLHRMTLEEKVGQMAQPAVVNMQGDCQWSGGALVPSCMQHVLGDLKVGSVLSGGGEWPQQNTPQANFIVVVQGRRGFTGELLTIEEGEIGAVLVFEHVLPVIVKDARVETGDAAIFAAVGRQVNVGIDVADGILAANDDVVFAAQVEFLVVGLDNETRGERGGRWSGSAAIRGSPGWLRSRRAKHTAAVGAESLAGGIDGAARGTDLAAGGRGGGDRLRGRWRRSICRYGRACQRLATFIAESRAIGILMA